MDYKNLIKRIFKKNEYTRRAGFIISGIFVGVGVQLIVAYAILASMLPWFSKVDELLLFPFTGLILLVIGAQLIYFLNHDD